MPESGTGRIYQRGGVWWIDYSYRGKRTRESTESVRRGDAVTLLQKRMGEIGRGQLVGRKAEKVTFDDLAQGIRDDYKVNGRRSVKSLEGSLKRLEKFFGMDRALDITTDRVKRYCA